jgi:hypothetical protein
MLQKPAHWRFVGSLAVSLIGAEPNARTARGKTQETRPTRRKLPP